LDRTDGMDTFPMVWFAPLATVLLRQMTRRLT
jgi:hypothetical protein